MTSAVLVSGLAARADVVFVTGEYYISDLPQGEPVVDDKVFSDFFVSATAKNTGNPPDASSIKVRGVKVDYPQYPGGYEYGLYFTGGWSAVGQQIVDTVIRYKVTVTDPDLWIHDNTLWLSSGSGANGGQASISETVYADTYPGPVVATKYVYHRQNGHQLFDHEDFGGLYKVLWIEKDVQVNGGIDLGGSAAISSFYQTFSQVPEPAMMSLLALGGLAVLKRRRRA